MSTAPRPAVADPASSSDRPVQELETSPTAEGAPSAPAADSTASPALFPELLAWQRFLRADWLLNSLTQNFMEPLVQFERLPARLAEVERDLAEGRIPADRLHLVEEELRTAQLWFADVAAALEDTDRTIQRLLTVVWERRKAARGIGGGGGGPRGAG